MIQTCAVSGKEFEVTDADLKFYERMGVPVPSLCPEERLRRRLSWRTQSTLYHRKCDYSGKSIISMYHPDCLFPVYHMKDWRDDNKFDPLKYGKDFDFSRPFFEQYKELLDRVPHPHAILQHPIENSEYCNRATNLKNCYLCFGMHTGEDCLYVETGFSLKDCVSGYMVSECELCYECVTCTNCYDCRFLRQCKNCSDSWFLEDCIGCSNCFGCTSFRNKQYCFSNQQFTKEEYEKKIEALNLSSASHLGKLEQYFSEFLRKQPKKTLKSS